MANFHSELDHLVLVAATLESGVAFCEKALGVRMTKGGEHARMGTHNFLLNLGDAIYLEVIAINPSGAAPEGARWFGMDHPEERSRAAVSPYLATFVARTSDIDAACTALPSLGAAREMQRDSLRWWITIPEESALLEGGALPTVIQWPQGVHPTQAMPDSGCRLEQLEVWHPRPESVGAMWERIGLHGGDRLVLRRAGADAGPCLRARIVTPEGTRIIG